MAWEMNRELDLVTLFCSLNHSICESFVISIIRAIALTKPLKKIARRAYTKVHTFKFLIKCVCKYL